MKRLAAVCMLVGALLWALALAQGAVPKPVFVETLRWASPADLPGVQSAWVMGSEGKPGLYLFRVRLAAGARIAPRTHPDERNSTVLGGTIHVGFGDQFDETNLVAMPAGTVYVAPANTPHYVWAKDGPAEFQESGIGPTRTLSMSR